MSCWAMTKSDAERIYGLLLQLSHAILTVLGLQLEPILPLARKRPWLDHGPRGVAYHYTGGPNGLKSMKWFNAPDWGNRVSSCHVMIFDRTTPDLLGEMWAAGPSELLSMFPVPTIILCPWNTGAWATNWINAWCLGVEMRNVGYHVKQYPLAGKEPVSIQGRRWEPYTREQLASAINIGRLVHARWPELWDAKYVVGHSMVCCEKADPGPSFPLHLVRRAADLDILPETMDWLRYYKRAPDDSENDAWWDMSTDVREEANTPAPWSWTTYTPMTGDVVDVAANLYAMGYLTGPEMPPSILFQQMVQWFQRSTHYYKVATDRLRVDGDPGPRTRAAIAKRMADMGITPKGAAPGANL